MKHFHGRFLTVFVALALVITLLPMDFVQNSALAEEYGMVINSTVKLRKEATSGSSYWFVLPIGHVCTIVKEVNNGGTHWYRVIAPHPDAADPTTARTYYGYIAEDYFRPLTDEELAEYQATKTVSTSSSTTTATTATTATSTTSDTTTTDATTTVANTTTSTAASSGTTGAITNGGTNFREGPSKKYRSLMKLDRGTVVTITSIPDGIGEDYWYGVSYDGKTGYICSEYIRVLSGSGSASVTVSPTATPAPVATAATYSSGTATLIKTSCHLRTSPNGSYNRDNDWEGYGSTLPLNGASKSAGGHIWYPVLKDNKTYYVREDCVNVTGVATAVPTATATPVAEAAAETTSAAEVTAAPTADVTSAYGTVTTTKAGCNLRSTIAGTVVKQIKRGVTLTVLMQPVTKNGYTWYYVEHDGNRGYLRSDVVKVNKASTTTATETTTTETTTTGTTTTTEATVTAGTVEDSSATGYVMTIASSVNLRTKAGYSSTLGRVDKGVIMPYYGTPTTVKGVTWYNVKHSTLGTGYIHGGYVTIVNADGSATPTPEPSTETVTATTVNGTATTEVEASYTTLRLGSTGTAVKNLVSALKSQGYYSGDVISKYTSAVQSAVKKFQKANNLSVDGIAGAATQHALYGTVPVGTSTASSLTMTLYPAEKIDWWTGGINELWARGTSYKVYDVKSGIVWWSYRQAGGYHVDAEPLTAADTARMCKAYGVTTASEIKSKNLYERRPLLVTIGTRTFACSLYGVPHGTQTITTNEYNGQYCIHFTNSWTHAGKKVDSGHTEAIQYAYENAPNGHK